MLVLDVLHKLAPSSTGKPASVSVSVPVARESAALPKIAAGLEHRQQSLLVVGCVEPREHVVRQIPECHVNQIVVDGGT
jgi:hypothetical protein